MKAESPTDEIRDVIRNSGLRCTAARLAVMRKLWRAKSPMTHAELADLLMPDGFDKATVFRNLVDLTEAGLLRRSELGDRVWRFEARDPHSKDEGEHPHFVCTQCGSVVCMTNMRLDTASRKQAREIGNITEILLKGECKTCTAGAAEAP